MNEYRWHNFGEGVKVLQFPDEAALVRLPGDYHVAPQYAEALAAELLKAAALARQWNAEAQEEAQA